MLPQLLHLSLDGPEPLLVFGLYPARLLAGLAPLPHTSGMSTARLSSWGEKEQRPSLPGGKTPLHISLLSGQYKDS